MSDGYYAKIIADSLAPNGVRLTTMEIKYPRFIHSEILTHRDRARNSASSRAIPWPKMMERIQNEPVIPLRFGSEQKGMQTGGEIENVTEATRIWLEARDHAVRAAEALAALGTHKSICNRLTEPWMWITVVMTATDWKNLFRLRCHPDAEIHFQHIAYMMRDSLENGDPRSLQMGEWHTPYVDEGEFGDVSKDEICASSTARCARVSYLTQDGKRELAEDNKLFDRLCQGSGFGHWSPHEHVATPAPVATDRSGPFRGWVQFRKMFPNECAPEV